MRFIFEEEAKAAPTIISQPYHGLIHLFANSFAARLFCCRWFAASPMLHATVLTQAQAHSVRSTVTHSLTHCLKHSVHTDCLWMYLFRLWVLIRWMLNKQFGHAQTNTHAHSHATTPKIHKLVAPPLPTSIITHKTSSIKYQFAWWKHGQTGKVRCCVGCTWWDDDRCVYVRVKEKQFMSLIESESKQIK